MRLPPAGTGCALDHLPECQVWVAPFSSTAAQREFVGQEMPYTEISSEAEVAWIMVAPVHDAAATEGGVLFPAEHADAARAMATNPTPIIRPATAVSIAGRVRRPV